MKNLSTFTLVFAITAAPCVFAQNAYISAASGDSAYTQADPAPIERAGVPQGGAASLQSGPAQGYPQDQGQRPPDVMATHPAHGVTVRADSATEVKTVAADAQHTELRLERGIANVIVRNPAPDMLLLVDLPGGQVQMLKDGFYTFNAGSNTARVFSGEADAFAANRDKPVHVKGGDQVVFNGGTARVSYSDPYYARVDVLAAPMMQGGGYGGQGYGGQGYGDQGYGDQGYADQGYAPVYNGFYGGYGGGFYGDYPYYTYGYPYGYYGGWGYPGFGLGLGFGYGYGWGGGYWGGGYGYRGGYGGRGGVGYPHPGGGFGGGGFHGGSVGGGGGFHGGGGGGGHR